MPGEVRRPSRVILGLGADDDMRLAIEAATTFASAVKSDLLCLLVEQEDLFSLAGLPFARAFGPGGMAATLTTQNIESHFKRVFLTAERTLMERCARANVSLRIERPQGETFKRISASLEEGDAVVFNMRKPPGGDHGLFGAARTLLSVAAAVIVPPPALGPSGPIIALSDGPGTAQAIAIAREIGKETGARVEILSGSEFELFHRRAAIIVAPLGIVDPMGEREFMRRVASTGAMAVLVSGHFKEQEPPPR
jgi:hypothetical protein